MKYKKISTSKSCNDLTSEQIYEIVNHQKNNGLPGYHCPKIYFDYKECRWLKKRAEILKQHRAQWPPENWPTDKESGNKVPPKKGTFIEEQIKWANSFSDPKKSQEVIESLEQRGKKIGEFNPFKSDFDIKKNTKNLLNNFREREKELENIRKQMNSVPEYRQNSIDAVITKIKADEYKPKPGKSNWSKNERVMYNEDAEFIGEQYPFWNPNPKETDKNKGAFSPNKIKLMHRAPIWSIGPKKGAESGNQNSSSEFIKARDERLEEKANGVLQKLGVDKAKYMINPVESYNKVLNHGKLPYLIKKPFDYKNTDQYKASEEKRNAETPAPNTYWDDGLSKIPMRKNIDDEQAKKYVMLRSKSYKRLYVANMKKGVF